MSDITIKPGVSIKGLEVQAAIAFLVACSIYRKYGYTCRLTSGTEGKHSPGSLHYVGLAIDLGILTIPKQMTETIYREITNSLGAEYDVVLESDHIHIEYQPKS